MKFDFNAKFLKSLNEILDPRFKALEGQLQANYVHCDDVLCKEDIEERLNELETIVEDSEIEHKVNIIDQDDLQDAFANSDLECRIDSLEDLETRITDLENHGFQRESRIDVLESEDLDLHTLKVLRDDQERRILTLESENQQVKERLLTLENFILKTLKGFKDD